MFLEHNICTPTTGLNLCIQDKSQVYTEIGVCNFAGRHRYDIVITYCFVGESLYRKEEELPGFKLSQIRARLIEKIKSQAAADFSIPK